MTIRANGTSITPSSRKSPDLRVETRRPWPTRSGRCSACRNGSRPEGRDEVGIPGFAHDVSVRRTDLDLEGRDEQPVSPCRTSRPVSSNGSRPGGSRRDGSGNTQTNSVTVPQWISTWRVETRSARSTKTVTRCRTPQWISTWRVETGAPAGVGDRGPEAALDLDLEGRDELDLVRRQVVGLNGSRIGVSRRAARPTSAPALASPPQWISTWRVETSGSGRGLCGAGAAAAMDLDLEGRDELRGGRRDGARLDAAMDLDLEGRDEPRTALAAAPSLRQWISTWRVETSGSSVALRRHQPVAAMDLDLEGRDESPRECPMCRPWEGPQWISTWRVETSRSWQVRVPLAPSAAMDLDLEGRDEAPRTALADKALGTPQWISTWRVETRTLAEIGCIADVLPQWISTWRVETSRELRCYGTAHDPPQWISTWRVETSQTRGLALRAWGCRNGSRPGGSRRASGRANLLRVMNAAMDLDLEGRDETSPATRQGRAGYCRNGSRPGGSRRGRGRRRGWVRPGGRNGSRPGGSRRGTGSNVDSSTGCPPPWISTWRVETSRHRPRPSHIRGRAAMDRDLEGRDDRTLRGPPCAASRCRNGSRPGGSRRDRGTGDDAGSHRVPQWISTWRVETRLQWTSALYWSMKAPQWISTWRVETRGRDAVDHQAAVVAAMDLDLEGRDESARSGVCGGLLGCRNGSRPGGSRRAQRPSPTGGLSQPPQWTRPGGSRRVSTLLAALLAAPLPQWISTWRVETRTSSG